MSEIFTESIHEQDMLTIKDAAGLHIRTVAVTDGEGEFAGIDPFSNSIKIIEPGHAWIHDGRSFMVGRLVSGVTAGSNIDILIQPTNACHTILKIAAGGDCEVHFYENTIFSAAGTALTIFNKNRYSTITSGSTITHTPTITGVGTEFPPNFLPGGSGGNASGGQGGGYSSEIILKGGLVYLLRITARATAGIYISTGVEYYEPSAT